jgi:nicotinamide mononucleotide (NMN) deamidase PncC
MHDDVTDLVRHIHATSRKVVLSITGGGASAAAWLLAVPGASRTVLEVLVPYANDSLDAWLGRPPASYCSAETTRQMARRARERAAWITPGEQVVGLACTASLRSDRPKKGEHRLHVATATVAGVVSLSLVLAKEQRERAAEEEVASRLVLNALAEALDVPARLALPLLPGEHIEREEQPAGGLLADLFAGRTLAVCVEPDGQVRTGPPIPAALLAGSFNPLHEGHRKLAALAARLCGGPAAFELSIVNADKPPLGESEARRRAAQFAWQAPLWLTRAPTFVLKAELFPGAVLVVGADTAARIVQPRFYGDSVEAMRQALATIRAHGCRFLVAGRIDAQGQFVGLESAGIPAEFADLFAGIAAADFRLDVSSTQLRKVARDSVAD